jgi:ABC-type phosphate transport system substrate-binding protein
MNKRIGKHVFSVIVMHVICALAAWNSQAWAAGPVQDLRGETFADPAMKFSMPKEWVKKPIVYEKKTGKADIAISLEQDVYQTILPLIRKYEKENNVKIDVQEGTCGIAAGMLAGKTVDMGGFCCPAGYEDRLPGLRFHTLGIVSKAFFVNPENPVENLSTAELRRIYQGSIHRWSELKAEKGQQKPNWRIKTVGRLHCQKRPGHWRQLLDNDKLFGPRMFEVGSIPDMISQVAGSREAIGWEVLSMVEKYKDKGMVKILRIDGYSPNDYKALASLKYPFYRTYNITTWEGEGVANPKAAKLLEYLMKEVEKIDSQKFGFVSHSRLKRAGWRFDRTELTGEPK